MRGELILSVNAAIAISVAINVKIGERQASLRYITADSLQLYNLRISQENEKSTLFRVDLIALTAACIIRVQMLPCTADNKFPSSQSTDYASRALLSRRDRAP